MRRLAALTAALLVGGAVPLAAGPVSGADPISSCTLERGTIVAVDFGHWGGPVVRGCGMNSATGYQLLINADFRTTGTAHDGPAFVCRIGNTAFKGGAQYPTPSAEPCALTPPASAYWSYWLAPKGQHSWSYSNLGAMSQHPQQGEVELWHFGATNIAGTCGSGVPPYSPDVLRPGGAGTSGGNGAGCSSTKDRSEAAGGRQTGATSHHSTSSGSGGGTGGGTRHGSRAGGDGSTTRAGSTVAGSAKSSAAAKQQASSTAASTAGSAPSSAASSSSSSTTAGSGGPTIVDARPASADTKQPSTGSLAPVLLGVTLAVLLAGGAGWTVWRRRRATGG